MTMRISKDRIDLDDNILRKPVLEDYGETTVGGSSGTNTGSSYTIDLTSGNVFNLILSANCTFTFSNSPASGILGSFTLILNQDSTGSRTVTWPGAVIWPGATTPTLQTSPNAYDIFQFSTYDGGTTWFGSSVGNAEELPTYTTTVFEYTDFSSTTGLNLVSCSTASNNVQLTTAVDGDVGNVWRTSAITYNHDFEVKLVMDIGGGDGADGFCVQWNDSSADGGGTGGNCGMVADSGQVNAIRFTTAGTDRVKWNEGATQNESEVSSLIFRTTAYYWIDYDHSAGTFKVRYNTADSKPQTPQHTFSGVSFSGTSYYIGIGAATGAQNDIHDLEYWKLSTA